MSDWRVKGQKTGKGDLEIQFDRFAIAYYVWKNLCTLRDCHL
jgi:hypothetical protein